MDEKDKKIARLEELLQSIKDNIDETESVLDSLSNSELQAENENDLPDDEFDRLLDEFIQSQLSEEETEDEEESDNSPSNTSHHIIFIWGVIRSGFLRVGGNEAKSVYL